MAWFALHKDDRIDLVCSADPAIGRDGDAEMIPAPSPLPDGATVYTIRPLSWVESQRWDGVPPAEQIGGVVRLGLVSVDGDDALGARVAKQPHPALAVPLYAAIMRATWGGFTSGAAG